MNQQYCQKIKKLIIKFQTVNLQIQMGAQCTAAFSSFKLPNLHEKNRYKFQQVNKKLTDENYNQFSRWIFGNNNPQLIKDQQQLLIHLFKLQKQQQFIDSKFFIKGQRLSKMYDYKKRNMKLFNQEDKPGFDIFEQLNVQFSYLSAVLYFLCKSKLFLRKRILLNPQINQKQIYSFRLFCNGQNHVVVIDDHIPTYQDKFVYSSIQGKQIWPCLLQKAWCKQIGSYQQARGLSPQQCFQQMTSIPTYSYQIHPQKLDTYQIISNLMKVKYFLCVVAKKQLTFMKPSQVFIIENLNQNKITLTSPFTDFKYPKIQQQKGTIKIDYSQFQQLFDYLIVGLYKENYSSTSIKLRSQKRQQKYFQINVDKQEQVSIRFTQFYNGYLSDQQKTHYDYSPLTIFQLYDHNGNLMNFCQGCDRLHAGVHSTYISNKIFHLLHSGTYFLRIEVDWQYSQLIKQGNIVIYSSQNNVHISSLDGMKDLKQNIKQLHKKTLTLPNTVIIPCESDNYELRYIQKKNNVLISVQNKSESELLRLELDFSESTNFRVKYEKMESKRVILNLGIKQTKFFQVLPEQVRTQYKIQPFSVKKLPNIEP